jgi:DNA end-binding protein Ku
MATTMSVSLGLVSVPVLVSPATEDHRVRLHEVHRRDGGRIRHRRVCDLDGQEVDYPDVARAVKMPDGTMAGRCRAGAAAAADNARDRGAGVRRS